MTEVVCGVDVSKNWLDAHIAPSGFARRFANTEAGIGDLAATCHGAGAGLAVLEASGGYERRAWSGLWEAGIPTAQVNPRNVRDFAKSMGFAEKTDRLDAAMIAEFGRARGERLNARPPAEGTARRIQTLSARLRQLVADITTNKQRLSSAPDDETRSSIGEVLALLTRQSRRVEGEIASMIDDDPLWNRLDAAFREVKGVATRTVIALLAELPEIGTLCEKKIAKISGLAPLANDSGTRNGKRHVRGGRANVRRILFVVAGIVRKYHPGLADMHRRLTEAGKPKLVVRTALARKLLVILNAKARDARREFQCTT